MFLIDKPYVSDFLIRTIKENNFPIVATPQAKELISDNSLHWISEKRAIEIVKNKPSTAIYSNSENVINWVNTNLSDSELPSQINLFKNKIAFRNLLKNLYPNYFYKGIPFNELKNLDVNHFKFPFIIKPAVGFFSMGVYRVDDPSEWITTLNNIKTEIKTIKGLYPKEVMDVSHFIIEEYIEGEEYAIDCYFNEKGEAVVLNILHHVFSSGKDVSDRVYSTSQKIIEAYISPIEVFLNAIGNKIGLKNFPLHLEVRILENGKIIPIEGNPMRFGGWCTTGDLSWYAYGFNSYQYFLHKKKPDWNTIFKTRMDKKYSILVLDNNSGFKENEIDFFDYKKLVADFEKPLVLRKINFREYPVFGFLFVENNSANEKELTTILKSNLQKYIKRK